MTKSGVCARKNLEKSSYHAKLGVMKLQSCKITFSFLREKIRRCQSPFKFIKPRPSYESSKIVMKYCLRYLKLRLKHSIPSYKPRVARVRLAYGRFDTNRFVDTTETTGL